MAKRAQILFLAIYFTLWRRFRLWFAPFLLEENLKTSQAQIYNLSQIRAALRRLAQIWLGRAKFNGRKQRKFNAKKQILKIPKNIICKVAYNPKTYRDSHKPAHSCAFGIKQKG